MMCSFKRSCHFLNVKHFSFKSEPLFQKRNVQNQSWQFWPCLEEVIDEKFQEVLNSCCLEIGKKLNLKDTY